MDLSSLLYQGQEIWNIFIGKVGTVMMTCWACVLSQTPCAGVSWPYFADDKTENLNVQKPCPGLSARARLQVYLTAYFTLSLGYPTAFPHWGKVDERFQPRCLNKWAGTGTEHGTEGNQWSSRARIPSTAPPTSCGWPWETGVPRCKCSAQLILQRHEWDRTELRAQSPEYPGWVSFQQALQKWARPAAGAQNVSHLFSSVQEETGSCL